MQGSIEPVKVVRKSFNGSFDQIRFDVVVVFCFGAKPEEIALNLFSFDISNLYLQFVYFGQPISLYAIDGPFNLIIIKRVILFLLLLQYCTYSILLFFS